jgi:hypothetical protein
MSAVKLASRNTVRLSDPSIWDSMALLYSCSDKDFNGVVRYRARKYLLHSLRWLLCGSGVLGNVRLW